MATTDEDATKSLNTNGEADATNNKEDADRDVVVEKQVTHQATTNNNNNNNDDQDNNKDKEKKIVTAKAPLSLRLKKGAVEKEIKISDANEATPWTGPAIKDHLHRKKRNKFSDSPSEDSSSSLLSFSLKKMHTAIQVLLFIWCMLTFEQVRRQHNHLREKGHDNLHSHHLRLSKNEFLNGGRKLSSTTQNKGPVNFLIETKKKIDSLPGKLKQIILKHNDNKKVPGIFFDERLYVLGARLTTSYVKSDNDVSFDLFAHGFGNGTSLEIISDDNDDGNNNNKKKRRKLLEYNDAKDVPLFCYVQEGNDDYDNDDKRTIDDVSKLMPMEFIPMVSYDTKSNGNTLIWRCDVTEYLDKDDLVEQSCSEKKKNYVTIHVMAKTNNDDEGSSHSNIMTLDIPISTGVVGYAGPQIKQSPFDKKSPPSQKLSSKSFVYQIDKDIETGEGYGVTLCVATSDINTTSSTSATTNFLEFLPEFVQHHINVGVQHIILGIDTEYEEKKDNTLTAVSRVLHDYIDNGYVSLGGMHDWSSTTSPKSTKKKLLEGIGKKNNNGVIQYSKTVDDKIRFEYRKLQFYQQCLYHSKGFSEYMIVLDDINELYIPPLKKNQEAKTKKSLKDAYVLSKPKDFSYEDISSHHELYNVNDDEDEGDSDNAEEVVDKDIIWSSKNSVYPKSTRLPNVVRMLTGLNLGSIVNNGKNNDCTDWCYQTFSTHQVDYDNIVGQNNNVELEDPDGNIYRFPIQQRNKKSNEKNKKPIVNTKYAHAVSNKIGGSCLVKKNNHNEDEYLSSNKQCKWIIDDDRNGMVGFVAQYHKDLSLFNYEEVEETKEEEEEEEEEAYDDDDDQYTSYLEKEQRRHHRRRHHRLLSSSSSNFVVDDEYTKSYRKTTLMQLKKRSTYMEKHKIDIEFDGIYSRKSKKTKKIKILAYEDKVGILLLVFNILFGLWFTFNDYVNKKISDSKKHKDDERDEAPTKEIPSSKEAKEQPAPFLLSKSKHSSADDSLPFGWVQLVDHSTEKVYYYNAEKDIKSWTRPIAVVSDDGGFENRQKSNISSEDNNDEEDSNDSKIKGPIVVSV